LTGAFHEQVSWHIERALAAAENEEKARRRLAGQIGAARTLEDLRDLNRILKARDALAVSPIGCRGTSAISPMPISTRSRRCSMRQP